MGRRLAFASLLCAASPLALAQLLPPVPAPAVAPTPITLDQAMADPDWIGPPVESAWWAWDGKRVQYTLKRAGGPVRDAWAQSADGGSGARVDGAALADLDAAAPVYNADRSRMLFLRNDDLFERDLRSGALVQITRSPDTEADPMYSADGRSVYFRVGDDWFRWRGADRLVAPAALPRAQKDPDGKPAADALRELQLRLSSTLARQQANRDALAAADAAERQADATRAAKPVYLGDGLRIDASALSPDGRWLLLVTSAKDAEAGKTDQIPHFVSASGYVEEEEARTRVGRNAPIPESLKLVDLASGAVRDLAYDPLPGIASDPLAALRAAQKLPALKGNRPVRIETDGDGSGPAIHWSADGSQVAVLVRAVDNKDRWIATVDFAAGRLQAAHR
ncbi:MAG TPA: S9 family peptidase, partial [Burkholderiaceae bacterium]